MIKYHAFYLYYMNFPITFQIAGIRHHYSEDMPLSFEGYIEPEPTNIHDPKAIAVYSAEGKLIGYIPRSETDIVRAWAKSNDPSLPCKIHLDISEKYNIYRGVVEIIPLIDLSGSDNIVKGKNIYVCGGVRQYIIRSLIDMLGGTLVSRLSKTTDLVIYTLDTLTKSVEERQTDKNYHFTLIPSNEFIKTAIPESERDARVFGKVISPATIRVSLLSDFLETYIQFNGGTYRQHYSKTYTEVVVQWDDIPTQVVEKAKSDNKDIVKCSDLLPELYDILSRKQNLDGVTIENLNFYDNENDVIKYGATEQEITNEQKTSKHTSKYTIGRDPEVDVEKLFDDIINKHSTIQLKIDHDQKEPNITNKPKAEEQGAWIGCATLLAIIGFIAYLIFS